MFAFGSEYIVPAYAAVNSTLLNVRDPERLTIHLLVEEAIAARVHLRGVCILIHIRNILYIYIMLHIYNCMCLYIYMLNVRDPERLTIHLLVEEAIAARIHVRGVGVLIYANGGTGRLPIESDYMFNLWPAQIH